MELTQTTESIVLQNGTEKPDPAWRPLQWRTLAEGAARLNVPPRTLRRAAAKKKLRAIRINDRGDWRTLDEWLDRYVLSLQK